MRYFCTYFDSNYLIRALALSRSLQRHVGDFRLHALCLDEGSYAALARCALPGVVPIPLAELEKGDEALVACKSNRSRVEYYYTCSPCLPLYVLNNYPDVDLVTYLDADLYFFADPDPVFHELEGRSIGIIEHRNSPRVPARKNGTYNVGWVSFRRDANGLECLRWWRERCIEWCYERAEEGKFADQGYLNDWPTRFRGVRVIQHKGANVAPWNVANYEVTDRDGCLWVDEAPLLFFHFHGFKQLLPWLYDTNLARTGARVGGVLRNRVYVPYIEELARHAALGVFTGSVRKPGDRYGWFLRWVRSAVRVTSALVARSYIVTRRGQLT